MTPIKTGEYLIHYFNRYGLMLDFLHGYADSLVAAQDQGNNTLQGIGLTPADRDRFQPVSFVIDRRIFNSLDQRK